MSLLMSSISHQQAGLEVREQFAFPPQEQERLLQQILRQPGVEGAVLLSTCNRTELYLSGSCGTPWRILVRAAQLPEDGLEEVFRTATGEDAARHLMEVSCGLHSQLQREEQILTQVRKAMDLARTCGTMDAALSTLFRMAVTVGKRVRTQIPVERGTPSAATETVDLLTRELGTLVGREILVIGNGQMGRLVAQTLQQVGAAVTVTLRRYRHRETIVPAGCTTIPYERRMDCLPTLDAIVTATTSPHFTVTAEQLRGRSGPLVLVDLAVPRDVEPECIGLPDVRYYNVDDFALDDAGQGKDEGAISALIDRQLEEYDRWQHSHTLPQTPFRFPMFVDLSGKTVVIVGGGTIAARRIATLRLFGCRVRVIAPELKIDLGDFDWEPRPYRTGDLRGATLAIAATDSREVNRQVGLDAGALGIPVSVADCQEECTFFFPAICTGGEVIAGVVSQGKNHHATARAARALRRTLAQLETTQEMGEKR